MRLSPYIFLLSVAVTQAQVNEVYPGMPVYAGMLFSTNAAPANNGPAWVAELGKSAATDGSTTTALAATNGAAKDSTVSVIVAWQYAGEAVTNVTDDAGNTYTKNWQSTDGTVTMQGWSSKLGSALAPGGNISLTWSNASYSYRAVWAGNVSGSTGVDVSTNDSAYNSTVICAVTTTTAPTLAVGALAVTTGGGYTVGNFSLVSSQVMGGGTTIYYQQAALATGGAKDMGGTISPANTYNAGWSAFK